MSTTDTTATEARATLIYKGVPIVVDVLSLDADTLTAIERRVERLLARDGWGVPAAGTATQPARPGGSASPPACPTHGTVKIREGQRGGYFCAAKLPDGSFCRERPI